MVYVPIKAVFAASVTFSLILNVILIRFKQLSEIEYQSKALKVSDSKLVTAFHHYSYSINNLSFSFSFIFIIFPYR